MLPVLSKSYGVSLGASYLIPIAIGAALLCLPLFLSPWLRFRGLTPGQRIQRGRISESRFELSSDVAQTSLEWSLLNEFVARPDVLYVVACNANAILARGEHGFDDFAGDWMITGLMIGEDGARGGHVAFGQLGI
jgi:hypothetical protein